MYFAKVRSFAFTVLKIATAIAVAAIFLGIAVWAVMSFRERAEEAADAPLAVLKRWPEVKVESLGNAVITLQTVWRKGLVYYQFDEEGFPPALRQARHGDRASFTITFLDKDGFKLFEHRLPMQDLVTAVGSDGEPAGLSWKGNELLEKDIYRRSARWEIEWQGFPLGSSDEASPPSPPASATANPHVAPDPKWTDVKLWRMLSKGISKDEVRQILGDPRKIDEMGFQTMWYWNYPYGASATFDREGKLESWSEP